MEQVKSIEMLKKELELLKKENKYLRQELGRNEMKRSFPETLFERFPHLKNIMWCEGSDGSFRSRERYRVLVSELIRKVICDSKDYKLLQLQGLTETEYGNYLQTLEDVLQALDGCAERSTKEVC